jgi:hypothetical protein
MPSTIAMTTRTILWQVVYLLLLRVVQSPFIQWYSQGIITLMDNLAPYLRGTVSACVCLCYVLRT